jgi:Fic family protein
MTRVKKELQEQLDLIKAVIGMFPNGASLEEIMAQTSLDLNERTFQRRLSVLLKEQKEIQVTGGSKATRYHLFAAEPEESYHPSLPTSIPLSSESQQILRYVSQALHRRKPVGYNRDFLDRYEPNRTQYFSGTELNRLEKVSKTSVANQSAGTYAREILNRLLIDLSWNSSRLEGNTYSLLDTRQLIEFGKIAEGKSARDAQMILNHKEAIEFLADSAEEIGFNRYTLLNLHGLLSNNLLSHPGAVGRLRTIEVGISGSVFIPLGIPQMISGLFDVLLEKAAAIQNPFERALFISIQLPYLQPFEDVNKRVSRLAANIPFFKGNLSPLSFLDVPSDLYTQGIKGVYELNEPALLKDVFIWAYERSADRYAAIQQSIGEPDPFRIKYREEMKALISRIVGQTLDVQAAQKEIEQGANRIPVQERAKFIETIETELLSLHEGNIARYRIRHTAFMQWKQAWDAGF